MKQVDISVHKKDDSYIFHIDIDDYITTTEVKRLSDIDRILILLFGKGNVIRVEIIEYIDDYQDSEYWFDICSFNEFLKDLLRSEGIYKEEIEECDYCHNELIWSHSRSRSICTNKNCESYNYN